MTGASGFVGANLARRLLGDGHEVHLLLRPGHRAWRVEELTDRVRRHEADLTDREAVGRVVTAVRPEWVFHLAAYGAYPQQADLDQMLRTNLMGTISLIEACLETDVAAFVNTGSSSEYGYKDHPPTEETWLEPNSYYAVTKASATLFCRFTAQRTGRAISTLRLYSAYGPYEEPTRLIPTLLVHGLRGKLPPLVDPTTARDFVFVEDVVDAFLLAARLGANEVFNVGTGRQTTIAEIVEVARRQLGVAAEPRWGSMAPRSWDTNVWVADNARSQSQLGWLPRVALDDGVAATVAWLRAHPVLLSHYERAQMAGAT
jgi:nucleoside-diphosphate-sugar epimerase